MLYNTAEKTPEEIRKEQDAAINSYFQAIRATIASLEAVKPIIKSYNGKVYNKNVAEALRAAKDRENNTPSRYVYSSTWSNHPNKPYLHISQDYKYKKHTDYTEYGKYEVEIVLILTEPEGNARPRIDAAATTKAIDDKIKSMQQEISEIIQARAGLDLYFRKIEETKKAMQEASEAIRGQNCHYGTNIFSKIYKTTHNLRECYR